MPNGKSSFGMTAFTHEFARLGESNFRINDFLKRVRCGPLHSSYCDWFAHFSRLLLPRSRISRNSPGPLMRRRLLRSRSSGGRAGSIRRSTYSGSSGLIARPRARAWCGRPQVGGLDSLIGNVQSSSFTPRQFQSDVTPPALAPAAASKPAGAFLTKSPGSGRQFLKRRGPSMPSHEHPRRSGRRRKARSASARRRQCTVLRCR
jgi:hypothetical protein